MLDLPEVMALRVYATFLVYRLREHNRDERGSVSETVIITAILAAAALAIMAIIVKKFTDKANAIPTE